MKNSSNNGTTKTASNRKGSRGPRPIMTVAQMREKLLREMMVKETRKIERKIGKLLKRKQTLALNLGATQTQLDNLNIMLTEYRAEASK